MATNACGIEGCVNPGCDHAAKSHVTLPAQQATSVCFACLEPGIGQMVANAEKLQAEQPDNPWTPVAAEFAAACSEFVQQAVQGDPREDTLLRLARAVERISQYGAFEKGTSRGSA